jgi:hypothetical protein
MKTNLRLAIDARLFARSDEVARKSRQRKRSILEKALKLYFRISLRSQRKPRPDVLLHFHHSVAKNSKLLRLLAK